MIKKFPLACAASFLLATLFIASPSHAQSSEDSRLLDERGISRCMAIQCDPDIDAKFKKEQKRIDLKNKKNERRSSEDSRLRDGEMSRCLALNCDPKFREEQKREDVKNKENERRAAGKIKKEQERIALQNTTVGQDISPESLRLLDSSKISAPVRALNPPPQLKPNLCDLHPGKFKGCSAF